MTKKHTPPPNTDPGALTHNPFAALANKKHAGTTDSVALGAAPLVHRVIPTKPLPVCKPSFRHETAGRSGKVVTRIKGLPLENLEAIAARLRKALGCGATVEGGDVLLLGMLGERLAKWLGEAGDLRKIVVEGPALVVPKVSTPVIEQPPARGASPVSGTKRSEIRPGQRVAIVMKADQLSGAQTVGVVRELLTNSETHPRGIKVRLESGEIGRVKIVLG